MRCNDIDLITRIKHSNDFKCEVESVFESIDFGVSVTPKLVSYSAITVSKFSGDNSWCRIPCEDRVVYCKKINNFWKDKYEIAYKTKLGIYGNEHSEIFYRVLIIEYDDYIIPDDYRYELRERMRIINRESLNRERTVRFNAIM